MSVSITNLGDSLATEIILNSKLDTDSLLKLLIYIYDQKNLASALVDLGININREKLNRWKKDSDKHPITLNTTETQKIKAALLPSKPVHWDKPNFKFIDLFAGIGGIRKGFEKVGGKCVFTCEWEEKARRTYLANHYVPDEELSYFIDSAENNQEQNTDYMDITKVTLSKNAEISEEEKAEHIRKHIPQHDVLLAGFPCQPFSLAGVSKKNSLGRAHGFECETQGTLFFDVEQIIAARQPKFFVLENVKNLKSHDKGNTFAVIVRTLDRLGYWVADISDEGEDIEAAISVVRKRKKEPVVIDGIDYLPQHRERVVLVGIRKDLPVDKKGLSLSNLNKPEVKLSIQDILCPLTAADREKYTSTANLWNYLYNYALKHLTQGNGFGFGLVDAADPLATTRTLSARYYKDGSEILINDQGLESEYLESKKPFCIAKIHARNEYVEPIIEEFIAANKDVTTAEIKAYRKVVADKYNTKFGRYAPEFDPLYKTPRRLTPKECARLMGFEKPEAFREAGDTDFRIVCPDTSAYTQFGNSVVVPVFESVAELLAPYIEAVAEL